MLTSSFKKLKELYLKYPFSKAQSSVGLNVIKFSDSFCSDKHEAKRFASVLLDKTISGKGYSGTVNLLLLIETLFPTPWDQVPSDG